MLALGCMQTQSLFRYAELSMPSICFKCSQVYMTTLAQPPYWRKRIQTHRYAMRHLLLDPPLYTIDHWNDLTRCR